MSNEYNRKERDAINRAFSAIEYLADCTNWTDPQMVREALRQERKARDSVSCAKALICEAVGAIPKLKDIADLHGMAPGLQVAYILGADWRKRRADKYAELIPLIKAASDSHRAASRRSIDKIMAK